MQKSTKYRKFYASKHKHPTAVVKTGIKGTSVLGKVTALREIEARIERKLNVVKMDSRGGQWVFYELIKGAWKKWWVYLLRVSVLLALAYTGAYYHYHML